MVPDTSVWCNTSALHTQLYENIFHKGKRGLSVPRRLKHLHWHQKITNRSTCPCKKTMYFGNSDYRQKESSKCWALRTFQGCCYSKHLLQIRFPSDLPWIASCPIPNQSEVIRDSKLQHSEILTPWLTTTACWSATCMHSSSCKPPAMLHPRKVPYVNDLQKNELSSLFHSSFPLHILLWNPKTSEDTESRSSTERPLVIAEPLASYSTTSIQHLLFNRCIYYKIWFSEQRAQHFCLWLAWEIRWARQEGNRESRSKISSRTFLQETWVGMWQGLFQL